MTPVSLLQGKTGFISYFGAERSIARRPCRRFRYRASGGNPMRGPTPTDCFAGAHEARSRRLGGQGGACLTHTEALRRSDRDEAPHTLFEAGVLRGYTHTVASRALKDAPAGGEGMRSVSVVPRCLRCNATGAPAGVPIGVGRVLKLEWLLLPRPPHAAASVSSLPPRT